MKTIRRGDIIWIDAEPHSGHEEGGHNPNTGNIQRPMIVLSRDSYNMGTGLVIGMMLTSTKRSLSPKLYKEFSDSKSGIHGKIATIQLPNFDFVSRNARVVGHVEDKQLLEELLERARSIFE